MHFGVCIVLLCMTLQQAVLWGGLAFSIFQQLMLNVSFDIITVVTETCPSGRNCSRIDFDSIFQDIANIGQEVDAEVCMSFFNSVLFVIMVPYTAATFLARTHTPGTNASLSGACARGR